MKFLLEKWYVIFKIDVLFNLAHTYEKVTQLSCVFFLSICCMNSAIMIVLLQSQGCEKLVFSMSAVLLCDSK